MMMMMMISTVHIIPVADHTLMTVIFLQALSGDFALNDAQKQVQHSLFQ